MNLIFKSMIIKQEVNKNLIIIKTILLLVNLEFNENIYKIRDKKFVNAGNPIRKAYLDLFSSILNKFYFFIYCFQNVEKK